MEDRVRPQAEQLVLRVWGTVIRRYRLWKRLSRRDLAARSGISPVFLGEIERGEKDPSTHSLLSLANALDAPLSELYMRVATQLGANTSRAPDAQPSLPLGVREAGSDYLEGVDPSKDETAFDLYRAARLLRSDQQVSLLVLARTLIPSEEGSPD
jgi:transcriptional regulator with XRE-family HTH domain